MNDQVQQRKRYVQNRGPAKINRPILRLRLRLMCNCDYVVNWVRGAGNPPIVTFDCGLHGTQKLWTCETDR